MVGLLCGRVFLSCLNTFPTDHLRAKGWQQENTTVKGTVKHSSWSVCCCIYSSTALLNSARSPCSSMFAHSSTSNQRLKMGNIFSRGNTCNLTETESSMDPPPPQFLHRKYTTTIMAAGCTEFDWLGIDGSSLKAKSN